MRLSRNSTNPTAGAAYMVKDVLFYFNLVTKDGFRPDEHASMQHYVNSLADVPAVGDYVDMPRGSDERGHTIRTPVRVIGRRIVYQPQGEVERFASDDPLTIIVTLMVERASIDTGMPDFRPS
jgi:hypothetical protein